MTSVSIPDSRANAMRGKCRVLLIGQDRLFRTADFAVDYIPTGLKMTPLADTNDHIGESRLRVFARMIAKLVRSRYDFVVLPALHFSISAHEPARRTQFRRFLRRCLSTGFARALFRRTPVLILDRYDKPDIAADFAGMVGATHYLKCNLPLARRCSRMGNGCVLEFLPFWLETEHYVVSNVEKDTDIFFSGSITSPVRARALEDLRTLEKKGLRVVINDRKIPMPEYLAYLRRSFITVSPEGIGYHCFRHYEAMLMESVPLVNRPGEPFATDMEHGITCLEYDATIDGQLQDIVIKALHDRANLLRWGQRLREYALRNHSIGAVSEVILRHAQRSPAANITPDNFA